MTPGQRCRSPLCANALRADNRTGFCRTCQKRPPGRRWYLRTRPDFPQRVAKRRRWEKAFKLDKRAHGLCVQCFKPGRPGKAKCEACQERDTFLQRERRHRAKRAA